MFGLYAKEEERFGRDRKDDKLTQPMNNKMGLSMTDSDSENNNSLNTDWKMWKGAIQILVVKRNL
jgi:hypothetical protein